MESETARYDQRETYIGSRVPVFGIPSRLMTSLVYPGFLPWDTKGIFKLQYQCFTLLVSQLFCLSMSCRSSNTSSLPPSSAQWRRRQVRVLSEAASIRGGGCRGQTQELAGRGRTLTRALEIKTSTVTSSRASLPDTGFLGHCRILCARRYSTSGAVTNVTRSMQRAPPPSRWSRSGNRVTNVTSTVIAPLWHHSYVTAPEIRHPS